MRWKSSMIRAHSTSAGTSPSPGTRLVWALSTARRSFSAATRVFSCSGRFADASRDLVRPLDRSPEVRSNGALDLAGVGRARYLFGLPGRPDEARDHGDCGRLRIEVHRVRQLVGASRIAAAQVAPLIAEVDEDAVALAREVPPCAALEGDHRGVREVGGRPQHELPAAPVPRLAEVLSRYVAKLLGAASKEEDGHVAFPCVAEERARLADRRPAAREFAARERGSLKRVALHAAVLRERGVVDV